MKEIAKVLFLKSMSRQGLVEFPESGDLWCCEQLRLCNTLREKSTDVFAVSVNTVINSDMKGQMSAL